MPQLSEQNWLAQLTQLLAQNTFIKATFAGPQRGAKLPAQRITIRAITLRDISHRQISSFDGRKDISQNVPTDGLSLALTPILAARFVNCRVELTDKILDARLTKNGDILLGEQPNTTAPTATSHNRTKQLPLQEGRQDHLLEAIGMLDRHGRVRPTMRDKFTQVNEFLKLLDHILDDAPIATRPLRILDCGSGAAYLTLAVHHWLNDIKQIPAQVLGVDINDEVIRKSADKGARLAHAPTFLTGKIGELQNISADIVIALHACDTATDDAIIQGVRSNAVIILVAPCCHKQLYDQLDAAPLQGMLRHGILRQRLAEQVTDALRAAALKARGYRADIIEFVSPEHTGRNLMIRAVKTRPTGDRTEFDALKNFWNVQPAIATLLESPTPSA